mmetsp:Transcript_29848/g.57738  ORF Transcript_29848/g.57738 Transcript_29848/m.57738 type:complete len:106 (+) Transcript_29848:547-864(+)
MREGSLLMKSRDVVQKFIRLGSKPKEVSELNCWSRMQKLNQCQCHFLFHDGSSVENLGLFGMIFAFALSRRGPWAHSSHLQFRNILVWKSNSVLTDLLAILSASG